MFIFLNLFGIRNTLFSIKEIMSYNKVLFIKAEGLILVLFFLSISFLIKGQASRKDTLVIPPQPPAKYDQFYDSLKYKAKQKKLTGMFYDLLVSPSRHEKDSKTLSVDY